MSCISLIIIYWISKYNVLRKRTFKNSYGSELSVEMTENLEIVLPIYCVLISMYSSFLTFGLSLSSLKVLKFQLMP